MKKIWYAPYKFESYGQEEIDAVVESLNSGWLGGQGPKSVEFEKQIAKRFGKKLNGKNMFEHEKTCLIKKKHFLIGKTTCLNWRDISIKRYSCFNSGRETNPQTNSKFRGLEHQPIGSCCTDLR